MHTRLISWSRMVYLAGIVLALVLVVPTAWFPFQLGKIAVFATLLAVALVLFIVGRGSEELRRTHGLRLALLVALLPLAYLLSAQFSIDKVLAFTGFSIETDTVVFTTLAFLAFILSFTLFKTLRTVRLLLGVVFWALVAAAVFQWVSIVFGTSIIPFQTFTDRSVNLIGKWNDLGILVGLLSIFLIAYAEFEETTMLRRGAVVVGLLVFAVLLGVVNFAVVWGLILAFSLASGLLAFLTRRDEELVKRVPWYSLGAAVVSIAFILFGSALNLGLTSIFPVSSLEVRPSYSSTLEVVNEERGSSLKEFAIGSGPNTFGEVWLLHKPNEVNQTQFWNLNFNVGFSTFVTALGSVGFVGGVMWLMPLFLVVLGILRAVRLGVLSREEKRAATTIGLGSLFLLIGLILYVPSPNIIILAFTLSGAAFGFLWRQGRSASTEEEVMPSRRGQMGALALALVCVVVAVWVGFAVDKRFVAEAKVSTGAIALQNGDAAQALKDASSSLDIEKNTDNARLFITAGNARLQQIAQNTKLSPADAQKQFADTLQPIIDTGKVAIAKYPNDYRLYFSLGQVYDFLSTVKIQGAYESARAAYQAAAVHNPTDPEIPLALARLEGTQGNLQATQSALSQALKLKPNYTDAIMLVVQIDIANNDIPNAIAATKVAAQTAPGVAPIWFELGLLYYASGDSANAIPPLEQALSIEPSYANAKYFLGLAYYAQKKVPNAITLFEDLAKTNTDSKEVALILSNMKAGKDPFTSSTPPVTNPVERPAAPLNE